MRYIFRELKNIVRIYKREMADRVGFEPTVRFHAHTRSRRAP